MLANASISFVHLERRFDPFFRPLFDVLLRDPLTSLTTALINMRCPDEQLQIAEEKPLPDEEEYLQSIISSFQTQMRDLWKPGGFERGGNTKTHGIVPGEFIVHDGLPENRAAASMLSRTPTVHGCGFPGPGPTSRPTSTTWAS